MAGQPFVFNIAKGMVRYYAGLPAATDALLIVLLKSGHQADDTLNNHATLSALLGAAGNVECDFTNYTRKTVSSVTPTQDNTANLWNFIFANLVWNNAGGATNNDIGKLIVGYLPATGGADSTVVPLTAHDFTITTDGTNLTGAPAATGVYSAEPVAGGF